MKNKHWLLYATFGLVFYLLFLIIQLPATWFAWGLSRYTQGAVRLDPVAGSLWSGNGRLMIYYPQTTPHDFGPAVWRINPFWLLAGRVQLSLQTSHPDRRVTSNIGFSRNSFVLKDTEAEMPADFIARIYAPLSLISPRGKVILISSEMVLTPEKLDGAVMLEWRNAASAHSSVNPLGDYRLKISGAGETAQLDLTTVTGSLELSGQGTWKLADHQVRFNGAAAPRDRSQDLSPLLGLLGEDRGGGRRLLTFNGRLP